MLSKRPRSVHCYPDSITFGFYTPDDIRKISVLQVVRPESFTPLGTPSPGGLYDAQMGTTERNTTCETCNLYPMHCPGHYGHIELPVPCFHPLFLRNVVNIMKMTCPACKRFLISGELRKNVYSNLHCNLGTIICSYFHFIGRKEEDDPDCKARTVEVRSNH